MEIATLAGGCFWCLEAVYDRMKGVESVESGYIGGKGPKPTYEAGCTGRTRPPQAGADAVRPQGGFYPGPPAVFFLIPDPTPHQPHGPVVGAPYQYASF